MLFSKFLHDIMLNIIHTKKKKFKWIFILSSGNFKLKLFFNTIPSIYDNKKFQKM